MRKPFLSAVGTFIVALLVVAAIGASDGLASTTGPSPIFGINIAIYDGQHDQFVDNAATQGQFAALHIPFVRVPLRSSASPATDLKALEVVKAIAAIPVVILHGPPDTNVLGIDMQYLSMVKQVFGTGPVYLEFGNEPDLPPASVSAQDYTSAWNSVIGELKANAPSSYLFGGPSTFHAQPAYAAYFAAHASPRPDFLSFHLYACGPAPKYTDAQCFTNTDHWVSDVQSTNAAVSAAGAGKLPLMISEWNLDPVADPRYSNAAFIQLWVAKAAQTLESLVGQGVIGAEFYTATDNGYGLNLLNSDNSYTPAGQEWSTQLAASIPVPPPVPAPNPPTPSQPAPVVRTHPTLHVRRAQLHGHILRVWLSAPAGLAGNATAVLMARRHTQRHRIERLTARSRIRGGRLRFVYRIPKRDRLIFSHAKHLRFLRVTVKTPAHGIYARAVVTLKVRVGR